jgi:hypothetical protein
VTPSHRAPGFLGLIIGVCLVLGALGVAVAQPRGTTRIDLQTGPAPATPAPVAQAAPATTAPTTAAPATTAALPAAPVRPAPRATARPTANAAPGVTFTAPAPPSTPSAPTASPVPAAAAGDSISSAPAQAGTTSTTASGTGSYAFLATTRTGAPARWNPCLPVHYVVNLAGAPAGALGVVQGAAARLGAATGMTLVYDGATTEVPTSSWGYQASAGFPSGWQPLLIGFAHAGQTDLLDGDNAGAAFPVTLEFTASGDLVDVSGAVAIDADQAAAVPLGFGGATLGSVVLHELGHAFGLAHVQDQGEIMNPVVGPWTPAAWGLGDREGLRRLGRDAGCARAVPAAPWG